MLDGIFQYWGFDWLAVLLTALGIWQLGDKSRFGFLTMSISNLFWLFLGIATQSLALVAANVAFCIMNFWAFIKWSLKRSDLLDCQ